ncbi:MAG TPA: site-2 protease family protein [Kiritimatiellia bacterium]|nr:site-2 protease family protein [Kiritimatiellia bacterium]
MKWSLPLLRVAGIPIRLHISFVLLILWIGWMGWSVGGLTSGLWAVALVLSLFFCVVLHELAHSLVAMRFGSEVRSITLLPIGGVASMRSIPEKPVHELLVALAGPAVNVGLVGLLAAVMGGWPSWSGMPPFPTNLRELGDALLRANVVLAAFNLVPAFPMDGGRVLRSLLATFLPRVRATLIAATVGQMLAVCFVLLGLWVNPFLAVIGIVVFLGAEGEERVVRVRHVLRHILAEDVMVTGVASLQPGDVVGRCLEYVYHKRQEDFPVLEDGRLVGLLVRSDWLTALHEKGSGARVGDVMRRHFLSLTPKTPLERLYQDLGMLRQSVFPVVREGRVLGMLSTEDIRRYLMVQETGGVAVVTAPAVPERSVGFRIDLG